jgi:hypothetical protein
MEVEPWTLAARPLFTGRSWKPLIGGTWTSPPVWSIHNGTQADGSSRPRSSALINTLRL